jgi:hypothetical protein
MGGFCCNLGRGHVHALEPQGTYKPLFKPFKQGTQHRKPWALPGCGNTLTRIHHISVRILLEVARVK